MLIELTTEDMDSISNWQCTDCALINFAERLQCQACFADRAVSQQASQQLIVRLKEREATMIVAFWLRTSMPDIHISYQHLDELMVRYYFVMKFEWNANTQIKSTVISDDLQTVTMINRFAQNSNCRSIYAQPELSARTLSTVQWELTCKEKGYEDTRLFMGYVDADYIADFQRTMIVGCKDHETAVFVKEGRRPQIFTNRVFTNMDTERRYTCEIGDRFRLDMDFEERVCTAFYNDECLGIISKVLPQRLYLAVSLLGDIVSLECTLFEAVYKN